jgi:hypothetical protein
MLMDKFEASFKAIGQTEAWIFSPYFIFIEIPLDRTVIRLPNGIESEDLWIENMTAAVQTQNIIIVHYLELIARDKQLDNYVHQMLGEMGVKGETIEELVEKEMFKTNEEIEKEKKDIKKAAKDAVNVVNKFRTGIGSLFGKAGLEVSFFRAEGPYEFAFRDRLTKMYFKEVSRNFAMVRDYFKAGFGAP